MILNSFELNLTEQKIKKIQATIAEVVRYSPMSRPNNHKIKIELG